MKRHGFALLLACIAWSPAGGQTLATNFQLHSRLTLADLGVNPTTDAHVWSVVGWADAASHREFALVSSTLRTTFVEVTNPAAAGVGLRGRDALRLR